MFIGGEGGEDWRMEREEETVASLRETSEKVKESVAGRMSHN